MTGTAAFEAFLLGRPALALGPGLSHWALGCGNASGSLRDEIAARIDRPIPDQTVIERIATLMSVRYPFVFVSPFYPGEPMLRRGNMRRLYEGLARPSGAAGRARCEVRQAACLGPMTIAIAHRKAHARMTSIKQLNRQIFDLAPARWVGTYIYDWRRRHQPPTQSTTTKFFRNLHQLAALEGPLSNLTQAASLSVLVAGCSYGCEAYSLGGFLALRFPRLNWRIDAVDISREALGVAEAARYTAEHGLGYAGRCGEANRNEAIRSIGRHMDSGAGHSPARRALRIGDVLSAEFQRFRNYDLVLGQNFMIYMKDASSEAALASLVAAARSGGALFLGGMDLDTKASLVARHKLVPLDWNVAEIHDADEMRRSAWPWYYWSLEPISRRRRDYLTRYSTIFLKP